MARGPLFLDSYSPQFSGHETFPLRHGWLKKAFDRVAETEHMLENRAACWEDEAIARFGVGRNMVASMRHWAKAAGMIQEPTKNLARTTGLGRLLFGAKGLDPFMEHPASLWLVHWQLAGPRRKDDMVLGFQPLPGSHIRA